MIERVGATTTLAVGTASAAAFGPESVKSLVTGSHDLWWFIGLFGAAIGLLFGGLWWRQRLRERDAATIVIAAIDPETEATGRSLHASAHAYAASISPTPVGPDPVHLNVDRASAAAEVDALGDRANEYISIAEAVVPPARRINLVLTARNAAAFRIGQKITKNHRKEIVVHHGDANGFHPIVRLAGGGNPLDGPCDVRCHDIDGGAAEMGCLFVNIGRGAESALARAQEGCATAGVGFLVEVRYTLHERLPSNQRAFEGVIAATLDAWEEFRRPGTRGPSRVILKCPAAIAAALGAQLATHPDGRWVPCDYINSESRYVDFCPKAPRAQP